jgi:PAT family beta-lactamase induction signal transducer AmpG
MKESVRAFLGSRAAFVGMIFALLPGGAYALGLALQSNLAVELGLDDPQVATLNLWTTVISAIGCVAGGFMSDRFGRRKMLALFFIGTALPTFYLAWVMQQHGWIMPVPMNMEGRPVPDAALVSMFWAMTIAYAVFQGLMYGTRTALFMDVTTPAVAATQFTAYMAMLNFVISYTAAWQGWAIEKYGYPITLAADGALGLVCILLLPMLAVKKKDGPAAPGPEAIPEAAQP